MQLSAELRSAGTALLKIGVGSRGYAIPSACVLGIERLCDWHGEAALDVLPLLGIAAPASLLDASDARVALLDAGEQPLPLLVRGALTLIHPAAGELLALPVAMQKLPLVSHIAVVNGKPSFFVLSPVRLAQARAAAISAPPIASR